MCACVRVEDLQNTAIKTCLSEKMWFIYNYSAIFLYESPLLSNGERELFSCSPPPPPILEYTIMQYFNQSSLTNA